MKILTILSHPFTLVISFFFIMISGHQIDHAYLVYIIAGLPYGAWYSIAGLIGTGVILYSHFRYIDREKTMDEYITNLVGVVMLVLSLFLFFYSNEATYAAEALNQGIFVASMMFFCIFVTCFIIIL